MKLKINSAAGIYDIISSVVFLFAPLVGLSTALVETTGDIAEGSTGSFSGFIIIMGIAGLALHIIGLIQSKKNNISTLGHILGIIGYALVTAFAFLLAFVAMILTILSAIFTLRQKNI